MDSEVHNLYACLQEQLELYRQLSLLSRDKQEQIVRNDLPGLERITKTEKELVLLLNNLENRRLELSSVLAKKLGLDAEKVTVSSILNKLEGELKTEGKRLVDELAAVLTQLAQTNKTNGELLEHSLQFVNYSLQIFTRLDKPGSLYGKDGKMPEDGQKRSVLDRKA